MLELGPKKFAAWAAQRRPLLITDTTFRDAHQSLLATRVRTYDMLASGPALARRLGALDHGLFSLEMWGGATFDTAMRFLSEDPWERLRQLRAAIPNICFQMLFRGSNAVGYSNYPDNVVAGFVQHAADSGIDIFRIFDSLNYLPNLRVAMEAVQDTHAVCEAALCYTGDILDRAPRQVLLEILRPDGPGTRENGRPFPRHQGYGGGLPAVRCAQAPQSAERGGWPPHPFSHP